MLQGRWGGRGAALFDAWASIASALLLCSVLSAALGDSAVVRFLAPVPGVALAAVAAASILRRDPKFSTWADRLTLSRAVLAGGCVTVVGLAVAGALPMRSWTLFLLAGVALATDAADGWVARRCGTVSPQGGRLDMETDAALLLVLSVPVALAVGHWAWAIGAMRYLFGAASWWRPALRAPLAYSSFRRVVAGFQGVALVTALLPLTPVALASAVTLVALVALLVSFGRDVWTLEMARRAGCRRSSTLLDVRHP